MIREYKTSDLSTLIQIWEAAANLAHPFLSHEFNVKIKKAMEEIYLPNAKTWVYEDTTGIKGFIAMIDNEIGGLFVSPEEHSKGLGTALVNCVSQYYDTLEIEVFNKNKIGRPFYEKFGFRPMSTYIHEESNEKVIRMSYKVR